MGSGDRFPSTEKDVRRKWPTFLAVLFVTGCTSTTVTYVDPREPPPRNFGVYVTEYDITRPYDVIGEARARKVPGLFAVCVMPEDLAPLLRQTAQTLGCQAVICVRYVPWSTWYRRRGLEGRGLLVRYKTAGQGSEREAREHFRRGYEYHKSGYMDLALREYQKCLAKDEHYANAHLNIALIYQYHKKDFEAAREHYRAFLHLNPDKSMRKKVAEQIREIDRAEGIEKARSWFQGLLSFIANIFNWAPRRS